MEYLYVCHFSNGHIKVGRSVSPKSRIASHADRVACIGVELVEHHIVACAGYSVPAETALIERCTQLAAKRNKSEWFEGLDYESVCEIANQFAQTGDGVKKYEHGDLPKQTAINLLGGTAKRASEAMGYSSVQAIYMWPDPLRPDVADRVRGVIARMSEKPKRTRTAKVA